MILQVTALFNPCFFFQAKKRLENSPWDSPTKKPDLDRSGGLSIGAAEYVSWKTVPGVAWLAPLAFWEVKFFCLSSGGSGVVCLKYYRRFKILRGFHIKTFHGNMWCFITESMHHPLNPYFFYRQQQFGTDLIWFHGLDFWTMQFLQILKINWGSTSKNLDPQQQLDVPSLKLKKRVYPWKLMGKEDFLLSFWGPPFFQVRTFNFREGILYVQYFRPSSGGECQIA